ncbi:formate/nitrite transporter family protein [Homoserinimonas sp. OAct 916]|uniref:formate/nitrite transporter family protein n=1 Tax=Homoserinimonas sp. OAct 916 TaxID=2211450 RepID=UPI000DBEA5A8|nr:formate/nitrite transporter family protein [Homoserinimonas sp. OAct 916]
MTFDNANQEPPAEGARLTAAQIFAVAHDTGEDELKRSSVGLALSGVAAGLGMGLTGLGAATILAAVGPAAPAAHLLAALLYPIGFIVVVMGRAQLFTENTLFPVLVVLATKKHIVKTLRLWVIVFAANILGALLFAVLVMKTPALSADLREALSMLGEKTVGSGDFAQIFFSGIIGGWIIALMAWLVSAARHSIGQIVIVYLTTFVVGAAGLAHCIAGSGEALAAMLDGRITAGEYGMWLAAAALGNIVGGVLIVSLLNYGQVMGSGRDIERAGQTLDEVVQDSSDRHEKERNGERSDDA